MVVPAGILALFFVALTLGVHLVTSLLALHNHVIARRRRGRGPIKLFVAILLLMAIVGSVGATIDASLLYYETTVAKTGSTDSAPDAWQYIVEGLGGLVQPLIGSVGLVYRCRRIYQGSWWITMIPLLLLVAAFSLIVVVIVKLLSTRNSSDPIEPAIARYMLAALALLSAQSVSTSIPIVMRLWAVNLEVRKYTVQRSTLDVSIHLVVDSGLLYTLVVITALAVRASSSHAYSLSNGSLVQILAITFNLMIMRSGKSSSTEFTEQQLSRFIEHALRDHATDASESSA